MHKYLKCATDITAAAGTAHMQRRTPKGKGLNVKNNPIKTKKFTSSGPKLKAIELPHREPNVINIYI